MSFIWYFADVVETQYDIVDIGDSNVFHVPFELTDNYLMDSDQLSNMNAGIDKEKVEGTILS